MPYWKLYEDYFESDRTSGSTCRLDHCNSFPFGRPSYGKSSVTHFTSHHTDPSTAASSPRGPGLWWTSPPCLPPPFQNPSGSTAQLWSFGGGESWRVASLGYWCGRWRLCNSGQGWWGEYVSTEDVLVFAFVAFNNVLTLWFCSSLLMCHVSPSTSYISGFSPRSFLVRVFCVCSVICS